MEKKILIIEDNEFDRKLMKYAFEDAGYQNLFFAEKGEEGVLEAKSKKPDLIIIDTMLPGMDGFQTCEEIRKIEDLKGAKIIIITGLIDAVDVVKARKLGADDYSVKTSDYAYLLEGIKKLIG